MRRGMTLIEIAIVLVIMGIIAATSIPRYAALRDRLAVHGATSALTTALADSRHLAMRSGRLTAFTVDTVRAIVVVRANIDTLSRTPLFQLFGVSLQATRDSIAYYATGLGYGAANSRFIVQRGASAETVTVSRVGRVRR